LVLHGGGRMGRAVVEACRGRDDVRVLGNLELRDGREAAFASAGDIPADAIVIDFSLAGAISPLIEGLGKSGRALVSGTTGLSLAEHELMREYSRRAPVFYAENMSYGIAVLGDLAARAAGAFAGEVDVAIIEAHHNRKKDAPSGTALALARAVTGGAGDVGDVPIHSIRAGDIPGDHEVVFAGDEEVLTLGHRAISRQVFARGAIRAARFLAGREPGLYRMADLVRAEREASIEGK